MPCKDYQSDEQYYRNQAADYSGQLKDLKGTCDNLTKMLCELCGFIKETTLLPLPNEVESWYKKHEEEDIKARSQQLIDNALKKLTKEEKVALGIKLGIDFDYI